MSNHVTVCNKCNTQNRPDSKFCTRCGEVLPLAPVTAAPEPPTQPEVVPVAAEDIKDTGQKFKQGVKERIKWVKDAFLGGESGHSSPSSGGKHRVPPLAKGAQIGDLSLVLQAYPLTYSNYYLVFDLTCPECGQTGQYHSGGICANCQTHLPQHLVHESADSRPEATGNLTEEEMLYLSHNNPFLVPHRRVRHMGERTYVWLPPLAQWRSLARIKTPQGLEQIVPWGQHITSALIALKGYTYYDSHPSGIEKIIIEGGTARLADLTSFRHLPPEQQAKTVKRDTAFLARILYYLASGHHVGSHSQADMDKVPPALRKIIEYGIQGNYATIAAMSNDLSRDLSKDDYGRSLKPASGKASDPGQVRTNNEDSLFAIETTQVQESRGIPISLYVVADGMGGHQAGEIASRTVSKIVTERVLNAKVIPGLKFETRRLTETPEGILRSAVQEANETLCQQARSKGSNMGTTLTVALIIGDTATIANVGDSRTYLLRKGDFLQITTDHSLVSSLVAAGAIQPEEVRTHPQRNQIYRSLGDKAQIEVDVFTESLHRGDYLVLCSDGLWEMVLDNEIKRVVQSASSPQVACDILIQKANEAGGEDNVTVIVVKME